MSRYAMKVPDNSIPKYLELLMILPPDWDFGDFKDEKTYWTIRELKKLGKFPHFNNTFINVGHTFSSDDNKNYHSTTKLCGATVLSADNFKNLSPLRLSENKEVSFYIVLPLLRSELEHKFEYGFRKLAKKMVKNKLNFILDVNRKSVIEDYEIIFLKLKNISRKIKKYLMFQYES